MIKITIESGANVQMTDKPIINNFGYISNHYYQTTTQTQTETQTETDTQTQTEERPTTLDKQKEAVMQLVREQIQTDKFSFKYILLPYYVAISLGLPKIWNREAFNDLFGINIPKDTWSRWLNGTDHRYQYREDEIYPVNDNLAPLFR